MNNALFSADTSKVLNLFAELSPKKLQTVYKRALREASKILVRESAESLKREGIKGITKVHPEWDGISLKKGIKYKVKSAEESKVHIMGDFRLKFFELGTQERFTKKGLSRGSIRKTNFFDKAKASKEREVFSSMDRLISESIQKIANK